MLKTKKFDENTIKTWKDADKILKPLFQGTA